MLWCYRISSSISLVIFSLFDTDVWEIFHEKQGSACSRGFGIQKQLLNLVVLLFFFGQSESAERSLTFMVSAYSQEYIKFVVFGFGPKMTGFERLPLPGSTTECNHGYIPPSFSGKPVL